jgi:cell division protein DivIC
MGAVRQKNVAKMETTYVKQQEDSENTAVRKKKKLFRRLSVFFVFALFISYFMISSILSQASALDEKTAQKKQMDQKLTALKNQQQSLKQEISNLNNDDYIAKLARKEYFLSNKDEIIFNIPDSNKEK